MSKTAYVLARLSLCAFFIVPIDPASSNAGGSTIRTVDSDGIVANVHVRIISTISGRTVFEGKTDDHGILVAGGLDSDTNYQAQTDDGSVWSSTFSGGSDIVFDLDARKIGWSPYAEIGLGLGLSAARYEGRTGANATASGLGGLAELNIGTVGAPIFAFGHPIRPIMETGLMFPLARSPTFSDQLGNDGSIKTSIRWRTSVGMSTSLRFRTFDFSPEIALAYVLSDSRFTTKVSGSGESRDRFLQHAIDLRIGTSIPLRRFSGFLLSASVEVSILAPIAGRGVNSNGVRASEDVVYNGIAGLRLSMPNRLTTRHALPLR